MPHVRNLPLIVLSLTGAAGCGGEEYNPTPPPVTVKTYAEYAAQNQNLNTQWGAQPAVDPSTLPIGGSARFDGVMALRLQNGPGEVLMNGAMRLDVNFSQNSLSGNAGGFVQQGETAVTGSLALTGGVLDRTANLATDYTFTGNIDGTLASGPDSYSVAGDFNGDFHGTNVDAAIGTVAGTAVLGGNTGYMFGTFIAEQ